MITAREEVGIDEDEPFRSLTRGLITIKLLTMHNPLMIQPEWLKVNCVVEY
jgi:hypothetical protein